MALTAERKRELVKLFLQRTVPAGEFAKQHGVTISNLYYWKIHEPKLDFPRSKEGEQIIAEWKESGLSGPKFAARKKISPQWLYRIRRSVERSEQDQEGESKLAEAKVEELKPLAPIVAGQKRQFTDEQKLAVLRDYEKHKDDITQNQYCQRLGIGRDLFHKWKVHFRGQLGKPDGRQRRLRTTEHSLSRHESNGQSAPLVAAGLRCPVCQCDIAAELEKLVLKLKAMQQITM